MKAWPAPEVVARPASTEEIPRNAAILARTAEAAGWTVMPLSYARGTAPDAHWAPGGVVDTVLFRAYRDGLCVVATWWDGRFRTGWLVVKGAGPVPLGARALRSVVGA